MGKKRRGQKVRLWRKKCPLLGLNDLQRGLRSDSRTARDNAASVFPLKDSDPAGESDHPFCFRGLGSQEKFPALYGEARLPDLRGREGARGSSRDPCSLFLNSPTHCALHSRGQCCGHYADYLKKAARGLAMVLTSRVTPTLRSLLGATWCLVSNMDIEPVWRISRDRLGKSPWGNTISI